jgi:diguanylate cyclase (GGDEF)-like protein
MEVSVDSLPAHSNANHSRHVQCKSSQNMANEKQTVRLLIIEDSQNEAERLVSLFRNAGRATRVHRLTSGDDLVEALQQSWDLLIAAPTSKQLEPSEALTALKRQAKDIPFIQLIDGNSIDDMTDALTLGASCALPQGEDELLMLLANRELAGLENRRARRSAEIALREAEKRCQLLLDSSIDPIAYVHDGMHMYANRTYMQAFDYEDVDELECIPLIDLIEAKQQGAFRDFLKSYRDSDTEQSFNCIKSNGKPFAARISLSPATFNGEPCIQVVVRSESDNAELEQKLREISSQDLVTGLFNRSHFINLMDRAVERAVQDSTSACLAYMRIDRYQVVQASTGIANTDLLLGDLASLLRQHFSEDTQLARFADDVFTALLSGKTAEMAQADMQILLKKVTEHLFEVGGRTIQISLSIGLADLDEKTAKAQTVIERAHRCADELEEGNALKIYDPADELAAEAKRGNVVAMVQQAIEQKHFQLMFQPVISLRGDSTEHYEASLHLRDSQDNNVAIEELLQAAKIAGLLEKIDRWTLQKAIELLSAHRSSGHNTRLFVSVSADIMQDQTFPAWLNSMLREARLPGDALILQFSESDAIEYLKQAKQLSQNLAELHCKIALSQYGLADNPLNALKHLSLDFVRIDPAYLQNLNDQDQQEKLKSLLGGLHAEGKASIVPGVNSAGVLSTLWQAGVHYIQGNYLAAPAPAMNYEFSSAEA